MFFHTSLLNAHIIGFTAYDKTSIHFKDIFIAVISVMSFTVLLSHVITAVQRWTAVTAYFSSKQLLLFAFALQSTIKCDDESFKSVAL